MRHNTSWLRGVLALGAALLVAGPGLLLADGSCPDYLIPVKARILGPGSVAPESSATFSLEVTFKDGSKGTNPPTTTFGVVTEGLKNPGSGTIGSSSGEYTNTGAGKVVITARFENSCGSAAANRKVTNE